MSEIRLKLENELLLNKSKAQMITLYLDKSEETDRLNAIIKILKDKLDYAKKQEEEKLNRIERAIAYNKYILHENWYGGKEKEYAQRNIDILIGIERELKELKEYNNEK